MKLRRNEYRVGRALCATGASNKTIGRYLGMSDHTVKSYVANIARALNVSGTGARTRIVVMAQKAGGFDQLAADLGLYDRDGESVQ